MQYIDLTDIYCYKKEITQNICTFLHIKYITSCTEHFFNKINIYNILNQYTHFIHLFLELIF